MALKHINGVDLYIEDQGSGTPVVFAHELGGDHRSWRSQVASLSQTQRCIAYSARGYPPSTVPEEAADYGWQIAVDDLVSVLDTLELDQAFIVGLSMGAYTGLMLALQHPDRISGLIFASGGTGAHPDTRAKFKADALAMADQVLEIGSTDLPGFMEGPSRVQLQNKDKAAWQKFADHFKQHSPLGTAMTLRHVQAQRPSLYDFEAELAALSVPTLLLAGDEDEHVLDVNLWLKRIMPYAGLNIFPKSGHLLNLEEPAEFNRCVQEFVARVEAGDWHRRDPRSQVTAKV